MTARLKRVTFSPVDAAWLRMDRPTNPMMITGVMMFDKPLDLARMKDIINTRMLRHDRFRQRVHESPLKMTLPQWEDDPHFDINAHVQRVALPAPGDVAELQELVSDLMSTPLDHERPLWHMTLVENFGTGSALIGRLHHCIGDGFALVQVLLDMTDEVAEPVEATRPKPRTRDLLAQAIVAPAKSGMSAAQKLAGAALHESWETLTHPKHALELAKQGQELVSQLARQGTDVVAAAGKLLLTLPDRKTVFRGPCGVSKRAAWSEPFPLDEVKAIGKRLGGTVNDVLLAAISGALRRYLEEVGQPTDDVQVNAMVPVSLRQAHEMGQLGNRFGLVILTLPVGTRDPIERLVIMKKRMSDIKNSPEALVAFTILNTMGLTPVDVERFMIDFFTAKTTAVMTNVPGPRQPLYLAGSRLNNLMFWVPAAGSLGMGISILSYAGTVMVGIMTDVCLVSDPIRIAEHFNAELREMQGWLTPPAVPLTDEEMEQLQAQEPLLATSSFEEAMAAAPMTADTAEAPVEEASVLQEVAAGLSEPGHNGKTAATRKPRKRQVKIEEPIAAPED